MPSTVVFLELFCLLTFISLIIMPYGIYACTIHNNVQFTSRDLEMCLSPNAYGNGQSH